MTVIPQKNTMINSLIQYLKQVKDFRKDSGKRHQLWVILLIVILEILANHQGYRAWGDFAKYNRNYLTQVLKIHPKRLPSYSTIRRAMIQVSSEELIEAFNQWCLEFFSYLPEEDRISGDGKCLRNTVENCRNSSQNWVSFVSIFSQKTGLVLNPALTF